MTTVHYREEQELIEEEIDDEFEDDDEEPDNHFLVMWCSEGLECVIPIDNGQAMMDKLLDNDRNYEKELGKQLFMMKMRANANMQRHYEIYKLDTHCGIDKEMIEQMFEDSPQFIVDLIREKGVKLYSNRATGKPAII